MPALSEKSPHGQNVASVHDRLREDIIRGKIPSGETSQVALSRALGDVGRTPLREALRLLQHEGLVISEPNRRVHISELTSSDAEDLYIMRISLEAIAVRVTVASLTTQQVATLEGFMAQMDSYVKNRDSDGLREAHRAFHAGLVVAAGDRAAASMAQLSDHAERYRVAAGAAVPEMWKRRRSEHRAILDAAADGDAELAEQRLVEHYARTASLIFEGLDPVYEPARLRTVISALTPGTKALKLLRTR